MKVISENHNTGCYNLVPGEGGVSGGMMPGAGAWQLMRGPISPATSRCNKYFLLLVDDLSRYMLVAMIPSKNHATAAINGIQARAEGESGIKLKALRTNRGGDFTAMEFADYCAAEGVHRQHTVPYSPQQNDVIEHWNGTVVAATRSMLKAKGLPRWF
jgi:transposase InsO family protein